MKKVLSVLLVVVMLSGVLPVFSFAGENDLNYLVIGDSIARGAGIINSSDACYGRIVADTNGYNYQNFGLDGQTTWVLLENLQTEQYINAVKWADIISISIGGNNFLTTGFLGNLAQGMAGMHDELDAIGEGCVNDIRKIIDYITSTNPDALILLQTLYNPRASVTTYAYQYVVDWVNRAVRTAAAEHPENTVIVDVAGILNYRADLIAVDTIHPGARANEMIADLILQTLNDRGLGANREGDIREVGINFIELNVVRIAKTLIRLVKEWFHLT